MTGVQSTMEVWERETIYPLGPELETLGYDLEELPQ